MSDYTSWHVGMKVVCVSPIINLNAYGDELIPVVGKVYALREIAPCSWSGIMSVYLAELVNPERRYILPNGSAIEGEPGFDAKHFRPVQTRKTDISVFTAMLHDKKERERA